MLLVVVRPKAFVHHVTRWIYAFYSTANSVQPKKKRYNFDQFYVSTANVIMFSSMATGFSIKSLTNNSHWAHELIIKRKNQQFCKVHIKISVWLSMDWYWLMSLLSCIWDQMCESAISNDARKMAIQKKPIRIIGRTKWWCALSKTTAEIRKSRHIITFLERWGVFLHFDTCLSSYCTQAVFWYTKKAYREKKSPTRFSIEIQVWILEAMA